MTILLTIGTFLLGITLAVIFFRKPTSFLPQNTDAELHQFWDAHMKIIVDELTAGHYPVPAINALYSRYPAPIMQRYGKIYRVELSTAYASGDKYAGGGCEMKGDTPILDIFVPNMMLIYNELNVRDAFPKKDFESMVVILFFHELDHIALGQVGIPNQSKAQFVQEESTTWAATSEGIITTMMNAGMQIDASDDAYYNDWTACGRQSNDCWRSAISNVYGNAAKSYK